MDNAARKIVRRAVEDAVRSFGQYDDGERAYYCFDWPHAEHGEVKQVTEAYEYAAERTGLTPERVRELVPPTKALASNAPILLAHGPR